MIISPTGKEPRGTDSQGCGAWGSGRGGRKHAGTDYICTAGQNVYAPITGRILRESRPYTEGPFSGCVIEGKGINITMFYFLPDKSKIGKLVLRGEVIGKAQDISAKYAGITPHVHLQINGIDPEMLRAQG